MRITSRKLRFWTPRALAIVFAAFISVFALDVFGEGFTVTALVMHLMPTLIVVAVLAIAWKRALLGAILFPALAIVAALFFSGATIEVLCFILAGPLLLIGALFFVDWLKRPAQAAAASS